MATIPESHAAILRSKALAHLATVNPDGTPQVTPVWFDFDGEHVIVNTAAGRLKDKNLTRDPHVALSIVDPDNDYRYIQIRGVVAERTEEGAAQNIDDLAMKYLGTKYGHWEPGMVRVIFKIRPERVQTMG